MDQRDAILAELLAGIDAGPLSDLIEGLAEVAATARSLPGPSTLPEQDETLRALRAIGRLLNCPTGAVETRFTAALARRYREGPR